MNQPPKWAQDLLLRAMLWLEQEGQDVSRVSLFWRKSLIPDSSSGYARDCRDIHIQAGNDRLDTKVVLLHELSHCVVGKTPGKTKWHSPAFWDMAWSLFRWAKLPIRYCKWREGGNWKGALIAYHEKRRPL